MSKKGMKLNQKPRVLKGITPACFLFRRFCPRARQWMDDDCVPKQKTDVFLVKLKVISSLALIFNFT